MLLLVGEAQALEDAFGIALHAGLAGLQRQALQATVDQGLLAGGQADAGDAMEQLDDAGEGLLVPLHRLDAAAPAHLPTPCPAAKTAPPELLQSHAFRGSIAVH